MIKKILVSQPKPTSERSPYFDIEKKYGVSFSFHQFIRVEAIEPREFRAQKVSVLDHTAVLFTSRYAIDNFFSLCKEMRIAIPETMKYFAVSESVSLYIQKYVQYRKRKVFFPATGKMVDLLPLMVKHKAEKFLVPLSDIHNDEIKDILDAQGLTHTECVMYRTVSNEYPADMPQDFEMIILFTPAGVTSLLKNFPDIKERNVKIATFGKATSQAAIEAGLEVELEAPTAKSPSITGCIDIYLEEHP